MVRVVTSNSLARSLIEKTLGLKGAGMAFLSIRFLYPFLREPVSWSEHHLHQQRANLTLRLRKRQLLCVTEVFSGPPGRSDGPTDVGFPARSRWLRLWWVCWWRVCWWWVR